MLSAVLRTRKEALTHSTSITITLAVLNRAEPATIAVVVCSVDRAIRALEF